MGISTPGQFTPDDMWFRHQLEFYGLRLGDMETSQLLAYFGLLTQWNKHINLVSNAPAEVWVRRHFAESLYLSRWVTLEGRLLDVGSGAGFPALPLKIAFPGVAVTLLEPVGKKRAFLKEVIRACDLAGVEVRSERLEDYDPGGETFSAATSRALGNFSTNIPQIFNYLEDGGSIFLWISARQASGLRKVSSGMIDWQEPVAIPGSEHRQIWRGHKKRFM